MATTKRSIIHSDRLGLTNIRLLNKEDQVDYTRVEGPSLKITSKFLSPEGKRLFLRLFVMAQLQFNFIGGVARAVMDAEIIAPLVEAIKVRIDELHATLNAAIDGAELLFKQHGITNVASYDTPPLEVEVPILCSMGRQYYEALVKFDQLMPLLQTLQIHDVVADADAAESCARLKGDFRRTAGVSRRMADRLRTRLFKEAADRQVSVTDAAPSQAASDQETIADRLVAGSSGPLAKVNSTPLRSSVSKKPATATTLTKKNAPTGEGGEVRLSASARKRLRKRIMRQAEEQARTVAAQLAASQPVSADAGDTPVIQVVGADIHNRMPPSSGEEITPSIEGTVQGTGVLPHSISAEALTANGTRRQAVDSQPSGFTGPAGKRALDEKADGPQPNERNQGPATESDLLHRKEFSEADSDVQVASRQPSTAANGSVVHVGNSSQLGHVIDDVNPPTGDVNVSIETLSDSDSGGGGKSLH